MSELLENSNLPYIAAGGVVLLTTWFLIKKLRGKPKRRNWPRDTVVLHQVGRGPWAPSLSPFPVKLETYLKMAEIPYVADHADGMSKKGKTPWITYNDDDVADSHFCIEYLNQKLDKCPNLVEYCERIKETFWPDWDEHITHGKTKLENLYK